MIRKIVENSNLTKEKEQGTSKPELPVLIDLTNRI